MVFGVAHGYRLLLWREAVVLPPQITDYPGKDRIRLMGVHPVVIPPDGDPVLFQQGCFFLLNRAEERLAALCCIQRGKESRFMNDQKIASGCCRSTNYIYRGHQRNGNAGALRLRISAFEAIAAIIIRRERRMVSDDPINNINNFHRKASLYACFRGSVRAWQAIQRKAHPSG